MADRFIQPIPSSQLSLTLRRSVCGYSLSGAGYDVPGTHYTSDSSSLDRQTAYRALCLENSVPREQIKVWSSCLFWGQMG